MKKSITGFLLYPYTPPTPPSIVYKIIYFRGSILLRSMKKEIKGKKGKTVG